MSSNAPDQAGQPRQSGQPDQPDQPDQPNQPNQPNQPDQPDQPGQSGNQSTPATDDAALGGRSRRERVLNLQAELVQQLTQLVRDMETGFQRISHVQLENAPQAAALSVSQAQQENVPHTALSVPWLEAPLTPSESLSSTRPLPWLDPPTPTTSVNPAETLPGNQTISYDSIWPPRRTYNLDQIRRRAERMALEHIESQLRERLQRTDREASLRRRPAGGIWISRTDQSGRMSRRIHISERDVQLFVMRYEVERVQQEIHLVCSGGDNTNN